MEPQKRDNTLTNMQVGQPIVLNSINLYYESADSFPRQNQTESTSYISQISFKANHLYTELNMTNDSIYHTELFRVTTGPSTLN